MNWVLDFEALKAALDVLNSKYYMENVKGEIKHGN
jgi:hypothetical protein